MDITLTNIHLVEYANKGGLWAGARQNAMYYTFDELDRIEDYIDETFEIVPTDTQVNDLLWFGTEELNEWLGISPEDWEKRERQWTMDKREGE